MDLLRVKAHDIHTFVASKGFIEVSPQKKSSKPAIGNHGTHSRPCTSRTYQDKIQRVINSTYDYLGLHVVPPPYLQPTDKKRGV